MKLGLLPSSVALPNCRPWHCQIWYFLTTVMDTDIVKDTATDTDIVKDTVADTVTVADIDDAYVLSVNAVISNPPVTPTSENIHSSLKLSTC